MHSLIYTWKAMLKGQREILKHFNRFYDILKQIDKYPNSPFLRRKVLFSATVNWDALESHRLVYVLHSLVFCFYCKRGINHGNFSTDF